MMVTLTMFQGMVVKLVPAGSPSHGGDIAVFVFDINQPSLSTPLFCSRVCFCLYGPFNCISFHEFSQQLFAFSLSSSLLISALFVLSNLHLFMKVSSGPGPRGLIFTWWGCYGLCFWHKLTSLPTPFYSVLVYFCLYGTFNCISFHKFSRQLSTFSLCSSGLLSALSVLSTIYLFVKVSFSPDIILCGWLGLKHQITN